MKNTSIICLTILVLWSVLALFQLWVTPLRAVTFVKISITAGVIDVIVLVIGLCRREYCEEKQMKKDGYID